MSHEGVVEAAEIEPAESDDRRVEGEQEIGLRTAVGDHGMLVVPLTSLSAEKAGATSMKLESSWLSGLPVMEMTKSPMSTGTVWNGASARYSSKVSVVVGPAAASKLARVV